MELYQLIGLAVMGAMGYVVHATVRLNGLRKSLGVERTALNFRDISVIRQPERFTAEERRLVRATWTSCAVLLALVIALFALLPPEMLDKLRTTGVQP